MATGLDGLMLVYAGDLLPEGRGPGRLAVLIPEPSGRRWAYHDHQAEWETAGREAATAILFWLPRDLRTLPGLAALAPTAWHSNRHGGLR